MSKLFSIVFLLSFSVYGQDAQILSFSEKRVCVPETDDCQSTLLVTTTKNKFKIDGLLGGFYLSKINNQILDCGGNTLRYGFYANIIDANGAILKIVHKNGVANCGVTNDQKYYFVVDESPILRLYNSNAELVFSQKVSFDSWVKFKLGTKKYELQVPGIP